MVDRRRVTLGSRVLIKELVVRADLNGCVDIIVANLPDGQERCGVRIDHKSIAVKLCNLIPFPCPPMINGPVRRRLWIRLHSQRGWFHVHQMLKGYHLRCNLDSECVEEFLGSQPSPRSPLGAS